MTVYKVDGIGTRKDGSGGEVANFSEGNKRFIRINVYADDGAAVTYTKGDAIAIEVNSGSGREITINGVATNAFDYLGIGNMATKAESGGANSSDALCIGVIDETVTVAAGEFLPVSVQVSGIASCNVHADTVAGDRLSIAASSVAGQLKYAASGVYEDDVIVAVALEADTANFANCILLNPLGL
jgi:hypothetical protein